MWKFLTDCMRSKPDPEHQDQSKTIETKKKDKFKPDGTRLYDWDEIIKHVDDEDCWLVYKGIVLDVSQYIDEHPGGENIIFKYAGRDCTEAFQKQDHSVYAKELLAGLKIGEVDPEAPIKYPNDEGNVDNDEDESD